MTGNRKPTALFAAAVLAVTAFAPVADAQQRLACTGYVTGVASQAMLEVTPGGLYTEGPGVAGWIRNQSFEYSFNGILFGGSEGFVSLVELHTGERIDRVWIGVSTTGFALRTEDGAAYAFQCGG